MGRLIHDGQHVDTVSTLGVLATWDRDDTQPPMDLRRIRSGALDEISRVGGSCAGFRQNLEYLVVLMIQRLAVAQMQKFYERSSIPMLRGDMEALLAGSVIAFETMHEDMAKLTARVRQ